MVFRARDAGEVGGNLRSALSAVRTAWLFACAKDFATDTQPPRYGRGVLFMVIERFNGRDARPIYRRVLESGRQMPEGLEFIDRWIEPNFDRCVQLMKTDDPCLLQRWVLAWNDLMEFEIVPGAFKGYAGDRVCLGRNLMSDRIDPEPRR